MGNSVEIVNVRSIQFINIIKFLCGIKPYSRPIYFSRHGESINNTKELIGGDSLLSERGLKYGTCLRKFFLAQEENFDDLKKYCSTLKRTQQTISFVDGIGKEDPIIKKEIDEIDAGN
jgi:6-phosphofructo-2-kinase / fructose-2,6-biphosphatase 2